MAIKIGRLSGCEKDRFGLKLQIQLHRAIRRLVLEKWTESIRGEKEQMSQAVVLDLEKGRILKCEWWESRQSFR